jgi:hypothetical protein
MKSLISSSLMARGTPPERGHAIADGPISRPGTVVALCWRPLWFTCPTMSAPAACTTSAQRVNPGTNFGSKPGRFEPRITADGCIRMASVTMTPAPPRASMA